MNEAYPLIDKKLLDEMNRILPSEPQTWNQINISFDYYEQQIVIIQSHPYFMEILYTFIFILVLFLFKILSRKINFTSLKIYFQRKVQRDDT